jgi:hypothetical protein
MAKFYGKVGYATEVETEPGIWEPTIVERTYYGELTRNSSKFQVSSEVNGKVDISNEISIVADPYATMNFHKIRYVEFMDTKWHVSHVEVKRPRLILSVGGVYNGEQA